MGESSAAVMNAGEPNVIEGPARLLGLVAACRDDGANFRWDLAQVVFGRDAKGNYAAATDSRVLAVMRWDAPPESRPVEPFGIPAFGLTALSRIGAKSDRGAGTIRVKLNPDSTRAIELERGGLTRGVIVLAPPGKFPPVLDKYERLATTPPSDAAGDFTSSRVPLSTESLAKVARIGEALNPRGIVTLRAIRLLPEGNGDSGFMFHLAGDGDGPEPMGLAGWVITMGLQTE